MTRSNGQKYWMYDSVKEGWFSSKPETYEERKKREEEEKAAAQERARKVDDATDVVQKLVSRGFIK
jgi:hypothetical protein